MTKFNRFKWETHLLRLPLLKIKYSFGDISIRSTTKWKTSGSINPKCFILNKKNPIPFPSLPRIIHFLLPTWMELWITGTLEKKRCMTIFYMIQFNIPVKSPYIKTKFFQLTTTSGCISISRKNSKLKSRTSEWGSIL